MAEVKPPPGFTLDGPPAPKLPAGFTLDQKTGGNAKRVGDDLPIPDPFSVAKTVVPPVVNFLDAPARAIAGDLYATVDAAKQQLSGGKPSWSRWWDMAGRATAAGEIPETPGGQKISGVLNLPGEVVVGAVRGASNLLLGKEKTQDVAPFAKVATDLAAPFVAGKLLKGKEPAYGPALPDPAVDVNVRAADIVAQRLQQDRRYGGPSAMEALEKLDAARTARKPMALVDVGDENMKALGGYVSRQPGESRALARSFLESRDKAASERLAQDIGQYVFSGPTMLQTTDTLLQARSRSARPLYEQAEALEGIWSPRLQEFISEPDVKRGLSRGFRLERLDALAEGRKFDPTQLGVDLDFEGNIVMKRVPNLRVLDMGKRGLDAMIADERDPLTGRLSAMGVSLNKVRQAYVNELDSLDTSGTYRAAREAWAGPSQSLDSMRWGRTIFNRTPEETARDFSLLSPNNQEFVRLGVADVLRERIAKTGFSGNEARAVIRNSWTRDQLRPIFRSDADFEKFSDAIMAEHDMAATTNKLLRNSATAERMVEDKAGMTPDVATSAVQMASHVIHGNFPMALVHGWRIQRRLRKDVGEDPALNEAVAKIIFNPDIDLADPLAQRMVTGPPPRSPAIKDAAGSAARYGGAAAAMGLTSMPTQ